MKALQRWIGVILHIIDNDRGEVNLDDAAGAEELEAEGELPLAAEELEERETEGTGEGELEPWQMEETDDDPDQGYSVDGKLHQAMKLKLKGRVTDRDGRITDLEAENAALKAKATPAGPTTLTRPNEDDFEDDDAGYQKALETYNDARTVETWKREQSLKDQTEAQASARAVVTEAVDAHYERAAKLTETSGIKPDIYKHSDETVRKAVESIRPNQGDMAVDYLISHLGEGSEKVIYFLGRPKNRAALDRFITLLSSDSSGMKAAMYLGQEKQRLTIPNKPRSQAPNPAPNVQGDANASAAGGALKKKHDAAHKTGDPQGAFNARREAKKAGVDVTAW